MIYLGSVREEYAANKELASMLADE